MNIAYKLADLIGGKPDGHRWTFDDDLREAFAGIRDDDVVVISWRGENYTLQRTPLRARVHNWLIAIGNRR